MLNRRFLLWLYIAICYSQKENEIELINTEDIVDRGSWTPKVIKPGVKVDLKIPPAFRQEPKVSSNAHVNKMFFEESFIGQDVKLEPRPRPNRRVKQSMHRFSEEEKIQLVRLHNLYRTNVTPTAGDMEWMQWDEKLEEMAQAWANTCIFEHGLPNHPRHYNKLGQNLYMGWDRAIWRPLYLWYEEYKDYNFYTTYCPPRPVQCGHYITMAWAASNRVGCAVNPCPPNNYYVVCHYYPPGNFPGEQPYKIGAPCSLCRNEDGGLCYNNLCVTKEDCQRNNLDCFCNLRCHNGGILDRNRCVCRCKDGWDAIDCSVECGDESHYCYKNPGFPTKASCPTNEGRVQTIYCRKMCEQCRGVDESRGNRPAEYVSNIHCEGKTCSPGYVLDDYCYCKLLCPGPKCGSCSLEVNILLFMTTVIMIIRLKV